jgi:hypothetical protein
MDYFGSKSTFDNLFLKKVSMTLFLFYIPVFILFCGLDVEDSAPPSAPKWIQKTLPEVWPERGIDAFEFHGIFIEWEPSPEGDVVAYSIYRATWEEIGDSISDFSQLDRLDNTSITDLQYIDVHTDFMTRYFYKICAEDDSGNLSDSPEAISYSLLQRIQHSAMSPNGVSEPLGPNRKLQWYYPYVVALENYCVTILSEKNELVLRTIFNPGTYVGTLDSWQIPDSIVLSPGTVYNWRIDMGANYVDNYETTGSESYWATFVFR